MKKFPLTDEEYLAELAKLLKAVDHLDIRVCVPLFKSAAELSTAKYMAEERVEVLERKAQSELMMKASLTLMTGHPVQMGLEDPPDEHEVIDGTKSQVGQLSPEEIAALEKEE